MRKIILDTNFLLIPAQFNLDIFSEIDRIMLEKYGLFVLDKSLEELKLIIKDKRQKLKNRNAAKLALQLVKAKKIPILPANKDQKVDDILADLKGYTIATQDIALKRRLRQKRVKIITLRSKKTLFLT